MNKKFSYAIQKMIFFVSISYVSKSKKFVEFNQMWHIHTQFTNTMINTNFPSYRLAGSVMNMHIYTSTGNIVCFFQLSYDIDTSHSVRE